MVTSKITPVTGQTRYNHSTCELEIFDGKGWKKAFTMTTIKNYTILEEGRVRNGVRWFSVECTDDVYLWLQRTYSKGIDYFQTNSLKGVWVDVPEHILTVIKLKY